MNTSRDRSAALESRARPASAAGHDPAHRNRYNSDTGNLFF
jgi:hypothetical protein